MIKMQEEEKEKGEGEEEGEEVCRRKIIPQFDARAMTRTPLGLRSIDRLPLCKGTSVKTGVKGV